MCAATCTLDTDCIPTLGCVAGACVKKPAGAACLPPGARCASTFCTQGRCCLAACDTRSATNICGSSGCDTHGACTFTAATTECATRCDGALIHRSHCNGTGGCTLDAAAVSCGAGKTCVAGACVPVVVQGPDAGTDGP
jgi:hypothetical protein